MEVKKARNMYAAIDIYSLKFFKIAVKNITETGIINMNFELLALNFSPSQQ